MKMFITENTKTTDTTRNPIRETNDNWMCPSSLLRIKHTIRMTLCMLFSLTSLSPEAKHGVLGGFENAWAPVPSGMGRGCRGDALSGRNG